MPNRKDIEHFERLGKAIAASHVPDPLPKNHLEVLAIMEAIDLRSGMGTKDPRGGDLPSHISYLEYRDSWLRM